MQVLLAVTKPHLSHIVFFAGLNKGGQNAELKTKYDSFSRVPFPT